MVEERNLRHLVELAVVEEEGNIEHGSAVFQERKTEEERIAVGLRFQEEEDSNWTLC